MFKRIILGGTSGGLFGVLVKDDRELVQMVCGDLYPCAPGNEEGVAGCQACSTVGTVPAPLAHYYANAAANLRVVELPFDPPRIELKQFWHKKFQNDARNRCLRRVIFRSFESRRQ